MRRLVVSVCLLASACTSALPVPSATAFAVPSPAVSPTMRVVPLGNGLVIDVPETWTLSGPDWVNRATQRLLLAANGDLDSLPGLPGNGDVDATRLPSGMVTVEIESFCRMSCRGPQDETALPFDWSTAAPVFESLEPEVRAAGRHEVGAAVRWFGVPIYMVARWADDAPAADIAAIPLVARSLRAEPALDPSGETHGWLGAGPLAALPVGTVRLVPLPAGAIRSQRIQDDSAVFVVRGAKELYAFSSRPLYDERCAIRFDPATDHFTCEREGRVYEWTRFGTLLGPPPQNSLSQHPVLVRDGVVWVNYTRDYGTGPVDETAER